TRYLALVENLGGETDRTIWDHVTGALRFVRELLDSPSDQAVFDRYVARLLEAPFSSVGWEPRPGGPADSWWLRWWMSDAVGGRVELGWRFVLEHLPAVLAKASARGRLHVLPHAASAFSDAARADELIALTRTHLDAAALYQAEKAADWLRLKAAVKAREARRAVGWAQARLPPD